MKINNYAFLEAISEEDIENGRQCHVLTPRPTDNTLVAVIGETTEGDWPYIVISEGRVNLGTVTDETDGKQWALGKMSPTYQEYRKALADGIPVLNVPFSIILDGNDEWAKELAGAKGFACTIHLTAPEKLDYKMYMFNDIIAGQCGNYLLTLNNGVIWANWLCLEEESANHMRGIARENKFLRGCQNAFSPIKPYPFLADEDGFRLDCRQFTSLEELQEFAEKWAQELLL